jgi:pimeloyl-ACP methyl ester carboxylesterase
MEAISNEHRNYALDLWGFGDSDKKRKRFDIDSYVNLLLDFMEEMGIWRTSIVGHTLGAAVAAEMAARHPDRVSKVLAVSLPLTEQAINRKLLSDGPNDSLARLFWHRQRPYAEVEGSLPKTAENAIALTIQSVARLDLRDTLEEIDLPLLSVYGGNDHVVCPDHALELESNHYAARAIVIPRARHFPMLDQTATFARLVLDFMDVESPEDLQQLTLKKEWRRRTR